MTEGGRLEIVETEPGLWGIVQHGCPGIGQKPALLGTDAGLVMVEVPAHIDDEAVARFRDLGGFAAIIALHPHMYGVQSRWSAAFDDAPVYVSRADREWLGVTPGNAVVWDGEIELAPGVRASQPGGHFPGSAVVHWVAPDRQGVLFSGDTIGTTPDLRWVTFMRSFPVWIPLSASVVRRVAAHVERYGFDRLYSNFGGCVPRDAEEVVRRSAERYAAWASGENDHLT